MSDDGDDWMARFIKEYDNLEDPDLRAELLMCHGIHPEVLASARRHIARHKKMLSTEQPTKPSEPRVRRMPRGTRRPITPRRAGSPRTYQVTHTRRIHTTGRTFTVMTTTVTVTTVTTVTTINS